MTSRSEDEFGGFYDDNNLFYDGLLDTEETDNSPIGIQEKKENKVQYKELILAKHKLREGKW